MTIVFVVLVVAAGTQLGKLMVALPAPDMRPDFSPDGAWIVYEHEEPDLRKSLRVSRPDGSEARLLTEFGYAPSWSPDGDRILFGRPSAQGSQPYVIAAEGGEPEPLLHPALEGLYFLAETRWARDGRSIYYVTHDPKPHTAWRLDLETGETEQAAPDGVDYVEETAGGTGVVYAKDGPASLTLVWRREADGAEQVVAPSIVDQRAFDVGPEAVYYVTLGPDPYGAGFLRSYEFVSGRTREHGMVMDRPSLGLAVSPDGRTVVTARVKNDGTDRGFQVFRIDD